VTETALLVPVPEAEAVASRWRRAHDPAAPAGIPAHVTVLYPFLNPPAIRPPLVRDLAALFAGVPPFDFALADRRCFPGVTWLSPVPAEPFRRLTERVFRRFPERPPYGGIHVAVIPHLTLAMADGPELVAAIDADLAGKLPVTAQATEVDLYVGSNQRGWRLRERFPLGPVRGGRRRALG